MATLSVIIPATDKPPTLARAVTAVRHAMGREDEVVVVEEPAGLVPAAARNQAAEGAQGDVLVFVDADVEVHPEALERIRRAFDDDERLTALFGSYDDDPARHGLVSDFRNLLHHHVHHEGAGEASTFWSGLGAVRRNAFLTIGGFDDRLRYLEDVDLGMRLAARGERIRLDPRIQGKHLKRWTLANMIYTDFAGRGIPWVRLLVENREHSTTLNLGWRHRASAAASLTLFAGLFARRIPVAVGAAGVLCALNGPFYGVLLRRRGWAQVAAGIPLHALHHVIGVAAVPAAAVLYAAERIHGR